MVALINLLTYILIYLLTYLCTHLYMQICSHLCTYRPAQRERHLQGAGCWARLQPVHCPHCRQAARQVALSTFPSGQHAMRLAVVELLKSYTLTMYNILLVISMGIYIYISIYVYIYMCVCVCGGVSTKTHITRLT